MSALPVLLMLISQAPVLTPPAPAEPPPAAQVQADPSSPALRIVATVGGSLVGVVGAMIIPGALQTMGGRAPCEYVLDCRGRDAWVLTAGMFASTALLAPLGAWAGDRLASGRAGYLPVALTGLAVSGLGAVLASTGLLLTPAQVDASGVLIQLGGVLQTLGTPLAAVVAAEWSHRSQFPAPAVMLTPTANGALVQVGGRW